MGRIITRDRQPPRPTRAQVDAENQRMAESIEQIAKNAVVPIVEWYMQQIPGLVAEMLAMGFAQNGLTFRAPQRPQPAQPAQPAQPEQSEQQQPVDPAGHTAVTDASPSSDAQHADQGDVSDGSDVSEGRR